MTELLDDEIDLETDVEPAVPVDPQAVEEALSDEPPVSTEVTLSDLPKVVGPTGATEPVPLPPAESTLDWEPPVQTSEAEEFRCLTEGGQPSTDCPPFMSDAAARDEQVLCPNCGSKYVIRTA